MDGLQQALRRAAETVGCSDTRFTRPWARTMLRSPTTSVESSILGDELHRSQRATAAPCPASSQHLPGEHAPPPGSLPCSSASAAISRLPTACPARPFAPPKRYWNTSASALLPPASATRQLRMSPGGSTPVRAAQPARAASVIAHRDDGGDVHPRIARPSGQPCAPGPGAPPAARCRRPSRRCAWGDPPEAAAARSAHRCRAVFASSPDAVMERRIQIHQRHSLTPSRPLDHDALPTPLPRSTPEQHVPHGVEDDRRCPGTATRSSRSTGRTPACCARPPPTRRRGSGSAPTR